MNPYEDQRLLTFRSSGGGWLSRLLLALAAASVVVIATVFLTLALIAGALVALVVGVRWWWKLRGIRADPKATEALEGEYTVIDRVETAERAER